MNNAKRISKVISRVIQVMIHLVVFIIKRVLVYAPKLLKTIVFNVGKRLRFSITFKTVTSYTFMFGMLLLLLSLIIGTAFGGLLIYEAQKDLEKISKVIEVSFVGNGTIAKDQINLYASTEEVAVTLLDSSKEVDFTTDEEGELPVQSLNASGITLINNKIFFTTPLSEEEDRKIIVVSRFFHKEVLYVIILMGVLFLSSATVLLISALKGSRNLKRMLKPIDDMINTARTMSANDLNTRLNVVNSHDELKDLAETFNEMLDRIQEAYEQQDRFVSDASHELRTPIAVIQGYANLLERWGKEDRAVLNESVTAIKNEAESMKSLVERLLFLARADKETQKINKVVFPLHELIEEVVRDTKVIATQSIILKANALVNIDADRDLIKQALRIFLDNSIKYTPVNGFISITTFVEKGQVNLCIEDNGIGISAEDLPFVFNRFFKCDKARSRGSGGTGLGLAIAKWIIDKHRGSVGIDSEVNKGTKVIIQLPMI